MQDAESAVTVAPILWKHIKPFKNILNIVENPSVGTLVVPPEIGELIDMTLETMLEASQNRGASRVRVICTVDYTRTLHLEVADDASWHDMASQFKLSESGMQADPLGGVIGISQAANGEVSAQLVIPLLSK